MEYSTFPLRLSNQRLPTSETVWILSKSPRCVSLPLLFLLSLSSVSVFSCLCLVWTVSGRRGEWQSLHLSSGSKAWQRLSFAFSAEADRPTLTRLASNPSSPPTFPSSALPAQGSPQAAWLLRSSLLSHSLRESTERTEAGAHWAERWGCVPGSVSGQRVKKHTPGTCSIADRSKSSGHGEHVSQHQELGLRFANVVPLQSSMHQQHHFAYVWMQGRKKYCSNVFF